MTDIDYEASKNNLVHDCLKEKFETDLMDILDFSKSIEELDAIIHPYLNRYFVQCDAIAAYYDSNYESFVPETGLEEDELKKQKCGCLKILRSYKLMSDAIDVLDSTDDIKVIDSQLNKFLDVYFDFCDKAIEYYSEDE